MSYQSPTLLEIEERRAQLAWSDQHNERAFLALFATICSWRGVPTSYLDLGSGTGSMVNMARKMGISSFGVDLIAEGPGREHWFITADLSRPLYLVVEADRGVQSDGGGSRGRVGWFDLITCLEVAEHIPPESSETLVRTIERHLHPGGIVVFSSASPGQSGEHHVNCRPSWEWKSRFYEVGLSYRDDYTRQLSLIWSLVGGPLQWLSANVQVFDS